MAGDGVGVWRLLDVSPVALSGVATLPCPHFLLLLDSCAEEGAGFVLFAGGEGREEEEEGGRSLEPLASLSSTI